MVLEPEVGDAIAQRQKKMVARVVARAEERARLGHEPAQCLEELRLRGERGLGVGDDVERVRGLAAEREGAEVGAGDDRRVDEGLERHGAEGHFVARGARGLERGAVSPAVREEQARRDDEVVLRGLLRIEDDQVPLEGEQRRGGRAAGRVEVAIDGREVIEGDVEGGRAGGDVDVDGVEVDVVAAPGEDLFAGADDEAGEIDDRAVGAVLAGDPLRVAEGQRAGGGGREGELRVENAARGVAAVDREGGAAVAASHGAARVQVSDVGWEAEGRWAEARRARSARLRHAKRPVLKRRFPVHVTWRMREDVWRLRKPRVL